MGFTVAILNDMLNSISSINYVKIHSGDPGEAGTDNIESTTENITWNTSIENSLTNYNTVTFEITGGTTINYITFWKDTTYAGQFAITEEYWASDGQYIILSHSGIEISLVE